MPQIPFGEWLPDIAPTLGQTTFAQNVVPITVGSYGPVGDLQSVGSALNGRCQGAASYRGEDGTVGTFAATASKLYHWNGTDWDDVSKSGGYTTADEDQWDFAQFGNYVIATNFTNEVQYWQLGVSTAFADLADLGDSPPQARFAEAVRGFMVLGRTSDGQNFISWSSIEDISGWTPGVNQSDEQELPVGGRVMGIVGGQYGLVFCETAVYRLTYTGDANIIFQIDQISLTRGCSAEGSIASYEDKVFFLADDGFFMVVAGAEPVPIGSQKVDNFFRNLCSQTFLDRISAVVDPINKRYVVTFTSNNSTDGRNDQQWFYQWEVNRWSYANVQIDIVAQMRTNVGYTGDNFPTATGDTSPDDPGVLSPDSSLLTGSPKAQLGVFGQDNKMSFQSGMPLEAIVSTVEGQITPGARTFTTQIWPECDGGTLSSAVAYRDRLNDSQNVTSYSTQNAVGYVPVRVNSRYQQALVKIAAGGTWTHAEGINIVSQQAGVR